MIGGVEGLLRYRHRAMGTEFEILFSNEDHSFASGAARAAFEEIDRLEQELSRFVPNSDISRINALPPDGSARIGLDAFRCLQAAEQHRAETGGAFDVATGALLECRVGKDRSLLHPAPAEIERARARSTMTSLEMDEATKTVRVHGPAPCIDLGAIGKGYAVDRAAELLREWGVASALVHGGTSSVVAFGQAGRHSGWPVTICDPGRPSEILETIVLSDRGLGGSGLRKGRHIIDPWTGRPVEGRRAAWVVSASATRSDALSTACMVMPAEEIQRCVVSDPTLRVVMIEGEGGGVIRFGPGVPA